MSDKMTPIPFERLLDWIIKEYRDQKTIFGIPEEKLFRNNDSRSLILLGEKLETPIGPAAGPHTQLAQNIASAYLCGGRFFELKTVQILDELEIEKPCIEAEDEGYNTEWSTELTVQQAFEEYVKAWFLLYFLKDYFKLSKNKERDFVFNMSVGYDLKGIKSKKIDDFIKNLKDASQGDFFNECKDILKRKIKKDEIPNIINSDFIEKISSHISNSITLSTMHGCPPEDQEEICKYLIKEKRLHTFVKLNPTLLGFDFVQNVFIKMGYKNIELKENSFKHDLQYDDAIKMLKRLQKFALENNREFGVKLSNTLPVINTKKILPGNEMYLSGRILHPLTINLASKLTSEFDGDLPISYSGGADIFNIKKIIQTGIQPITMATVLLKPGGYFRLKQIADALMKAEDNMLPKGRKIDVEKLQKLAEESLNEVDYIKQRKPVHDRKIELKLPLTDCYIAPCMQGCPINQDIPEYIRLVSEKRYKKALEVILTKNPLPFITGYICDHKCMLKCTRLDYEDPILIREMKRIAAEKGYSENLPNFYKFGKFEKKTAIIGAGPSGLSCGYFLSKAGFNVTIFEKTDKPGGVVQHTIPNFRIPQKAIENDLDIIKKTGVKFQFNSDANFSIKALKESGFDYIVLSIGAGKSRKLQLDVNGEKVLDAIAFLKKFKKEKKSLDIGKNIAVIGGGNSAMDAARAALRVEGVEKVYIIYRRTREFMPAEKEELENALKDGVIFKELLNPVSFHNSILKCSKMKLGEPDKSGRKRPIPIKNSFEEFKIDYVLSAIGEIADYDILQKNGIEVDSNWDIAVNKETNETNIENVFIGGDAFRGPSTVVEAIADGTKIAKAIISKKGEIPENFFEYKTDFNNKNRIREITSKKGIIKAGLDLRESDTIGFESRTTDQGNRSEEIRNKFRSTLKLSETSNEENLIDKFRKVELEAERCLECNFICNICTEVCPNRANIPIKVKSENFKDIYQILHLDGMCNECGNCETFCPYQGAPYKDKFTLFWKNEDFLSSQNNGFIVLDEQNIKLRFNHIIYNLFRQNGEIKLCNPYGIFQKEMQNLFDIISTVLKNYTQILN